jgi:hypothetical protein
VKDTVIGDKNPSIGASWPLFAGKLVVAFFDVDENRADFCNIIGSNKF